MANITTCTRCGTLYEAGSEEQANEPGRMCPTCRMPRTAWGKLTEPGSDTVTLESSPPFDGGVPMIEGCSCIHCSHHRAHELAQRGAWWHQRVQLTPKGLELLEASLELCELHGVGPDCPQCDRGGQA